MMKRLTIWSWLTLAALTCGTTGYLVVGCASKPITITTPAGTTAFTADQAVIRVNELMNAAIQANTQGALDTPTTRIIVTFAVDADTVLAKTPAGWQATVKAAWAIAQPKIVTTNPTVRLAIAAADAAIEGLE